MACGDLSGFDADQSYEINFGYTRQEPIIIPINPPYKLAIEKKRNNKLQQTPQPTILPAEIEEVEEKNLEI